MAISRDEVVHVARLARLALTEEELDRFAGQLDAILEAVGKVSELDLSGVEATPHTLALSNVWEGYAQQKFMRSTDGGSTWDVLPGSAFVASHQIFHITWGWADPSTACPSH